MLLINLCLGIDFTKTGDEEFSVVDAVGFSSECFDFCVYGFGRCVCRTVVKEVDNLLGVLVECGGYYVE
ncbi:hypothetical protein JCM10556A_11960 [Bacteroides acidifaciens]|jgi:hypothetical protein